MLLRLSRLSLWLAAAAGGLAVVGPPEHRLLCTDVALALAAIAFLLWRAALAVRQRSECPSDAVPDAIRLDVAALRDAEALVVDRVAHAPSFEAALHAIAEILRGELGARSVQVFVVCPEANGLSVRQLIADQPGFLAPQRALIESGSALGPALREQRPWIDLPRTVALPVLREGRVVALVELLGIDIAIEETALAQLLATAQRSLGAPAAMPVKPTEATQRFSSAGSHGALGGCAEPSPC